MIDAAQTQNQAVTPPARGQAVLTMVKSDRMAGEIPVWTTDPTARGSVSSNIEAAGAGKDPSTSAALSYAAPGNNADGKSTAGQAFSFGDILDMINPLQHIPLVNQLYRHITGDQIKPVSQVIGDTIFGGPVGGAISLANVMVTHETGHDIAGSVMAFVSGEKTTYRSAAVSNPAGNANGGGSAPERRLGALDLDSGTSNNNVTNANSDSSGTVVSVTDLGAGKSRVAERISAGQDRMAGSMIALRTEEAKRDQNSAAAQTAPAVAPASPYSRNLAAAASALTLNEVSPAAGETQAPVKTRLAMQGAFHSLHLND